MEWLLLDTCSAFFRHLFFSESDTHTYSEHWTGIVLSEKKKKKPNTTQTQKTNPQNTNSPSPQKSPLKTIKET